VVEPVAIVDVEREAGDGQTLHHLVVQFEADEVPEPFGVLLGPPAVVSRHRLPTVQVEPPPSAVVRDDSAVHEVEVTPVSPEALVPLLRPDRGRELQVLAETGRDVLEGRTIWNISSTAAGGGVSEMLHRLVRYVLGAGVACRWLVIDGTPEFFAVTKRVHNRMHGEQGDDGTLGDAERAVFRRVAEANGEALAGLVAAGDVVIVHDPQPIGLIPALRSAGHPVIWRCHVGTETHNEWTDQAWAFLRPWVELADALVFSRPQYMPDWLPATRARVIAPAIDPLSAKNQPLDDDAVLATLGGAGIVDHSDAGTFVDSGGRPQRVSIKANVLRDGGPLAPDVPLLVQVSRWDRLKDMAGVLQAFADAGVGKDTGSHLLLVGPDVAGVTDDPEGKQVLDECKAMWEALPAGARSTVSLVSLPMDDLDQNAIVVNAVQRHATVVAQKSIREGFGLTVAEAMWKGRPVVGSAVGGIQDQIRDGVDGLLIADPRDLNAFAAAVRSLLEDSDRAKQMGEAAHERVRDNFLADRDLGQWMQLLGHLGIGR
jgi:trehalose synthase